LSKIVPVSRNELIKRLKTLGFGGPYPGSGHAYMVKEMTEGRLYVTIPNPHHGEDIGVGLLVEILRKAKISREEWFSIT
jgi:predicted RNA binding protein YcfA (HicA-like mRNA interferase family)